MSDPEILRQYREEGVTINAWDYADEAGDNILRHKKGEYTATRWRSVDCLAPYVCEDISKKDYATTIDAGLQDKLFSSFSQDQKKYIARKALFHEITPGRIYWAEAAENLGERMKSDNFRVFSEHRNDDDAVKSILSEGTSLIAHRARNHVDLRGDNGSINALAATLMAPEMKLDERLRCDLAAHFLAHAKLQQRSKYQFNVIAGNLPQEAQPICHKVRSAGVEPEIMDHHASLMTQTDEHFRRDLINAQRDILDVAKETIGSKVPGTQNLSQDERCLFKSQIALTGRLITRAEKEGVYSCATGNANKQLFALGNVTGGSEAALIAPEAVRLQRTKERTMENNTAKKLESLEI